MNAIVKFEEKVIKQIYHYSGFFNSIYNRVGVVIIQRVWVGSGLPFNLADVLSSVRGRINKNEPAAAGNISPQVANAP